MKTTTFKQTFPFPYIVNCLQKDHALPFGRDIECYFFTMKRLHYIIFPSLFIALTVLISCVKQQGPSSLGAMGLLVNNESDHAIAEPGAYAFYSFLQQLSAPQTDSLQTVLHQAAPIFLPDSTLHADLTLFGVELAYTDSIRLLYYEYTKATPPESYAYLASFNQGGRALDLVAIKEASYNGNAAVNLIDGEILEMEYYDVYNQEGMQEFALNFEYYQILADGRLQLLSKPERISSERAYLEASTRLLSSDELKRYPAPQLKTMEMELLAEYGQIFSSSQWQEYFEQQAWYTARHAECEAMLSGLELVNLRKIREVQVQL